MENAFLFHNQPTNQALLDCQNFGSLQTKANFCNPAKALLEQTNSFWKLSEADFVNQSTNHCLTKQ